MIYMDSIDNSKDIKVINSEINSEGVFTHIALDLVEGIVFGGVLGVGTDIIATAVSTLPNSFLTPAMVSPLSVVVGALVFVGVSIHQIRQRLNK